MWYLSRSSLEQAGGGGTWGRTRFSNGRDINAEFIQSQKIGNFWSSSSTSPPPPPHPMTPSWLLQLLQLQSGYIHNVKFYHNYMKPTYSVLVTKDLYKHLLTRPRLRPSVNPRETPGISRSSSSNFRHEKYIWIHLNKKTYMLCKNVKSIHRLLLKLCGHKHTEEFFHSSYYYNTYVTWTEYEWINII